VIIIKLITLKQLQSKTVCTTKHQIIWQTGWMTSTTKHSGTSSLECYSE